MELKHLFRKLLGLLRGQPETPARGSHLLLPLEGFPSWVRQELVLVKARSRRRR